MKTLITTMALAMLFAVSANADIIHQTDYEGTAATGFGITSAELEFTDGGGDLIGFSANGNALTTGDALGLSSANPNSGSFHYAVDVGQTTPAGNGWGASWSGINTGSALGSGGFFADQASAVAAGPGSQYIDFSAGATFTVSAFVATDAANPLTGGGTAAPRLEFFNAAGAELFRNQSAQVDATTLSSTYQSVSHTYTLSAADAAAGVVRVSGVLGTDGQGDGAGTGFIYYDDFLFEVSSANVFTVPAAIPEPSSACLLLAGLMGLCGVRRRKS